ncbi:hypothetical protein H0H92_002830 [Tricholoma furcatifolium]|nr:hypothetical protein H0H92_002830 [Tricholoma furcatifolium]
MNQSQILASVLKDTMFLRDIQVLHALADIPRETNDVMEDAQDTVERIVVEKIVELVDTLKEKEREPIPISFPGSDIDISVLEELNIKICGFLEKNCDFTDRAVLESVPQGGAAYMTSEQMYSRLNMLANLIPQNVLSHQAPRNVYLQLTLAPLKNVAQSRRLWIDVFLFRVSAMVQGCMVLNVEQDIPSLSVSISGKKQPYEIDGTVNYAALTGASPAQHDWFLRCSTEFGDLKFQYESFNGLLVIQVSHKEDNYIRRVLIAMYTSAKSLKTSLARKKVIRGAMTDGFTWRFVILHLREDGDGGSSWISSTYEIQTCGTHDREVRGKEPDIIAGILHYWIQRSFDPLDAGDWFYMKDR